MNTAALTLSLLLWIIPAKDKPRSERVAALCPDLSQHPSDWGKDICIYSSGLQLEGHDLKWGKNKNMHVHNMHM